ncbi:MAG: SIS domain-containing protein [Blastocatellia bacterium]
MNSAADGQQATFREIYNQAIASEQTVSRHQDRLTQFEKLLPLDSYTDIILTGCGSSYNLARCVAFAWTLLLERPVSGIAASELMNFPERYLSAGSRPLVIAISRTGGTTEVLLAVERLRADYGGAALAVTCQANSPIGNICDEEMAFDECLEESIVMTQAFTSMLLGLYLLGDGAAKGSYNSQLAAAPNLIGRNLACSEAIVRPLAENPGVNQFFFLGSGPMKGLADECALKMTEMALAVAAGYRLLEFRHGPKAALNAESLTVLFPTAPEDPHLETLLGEIGETGSKNLIVGRRVGDKMPTDSKRVLSLGFDDNLPDFFRPVLYAHIGHLLAYFRAQALNINPDCPRHLARTVLLNR